MTRSPFKRKWHLGRLAVTVKATPKSALWGRFGSGWNWAVGVKVGGCTAIVDLLVLPVRFDYDGLTSGERP